MAQDDSIPLTKGYLLVVGHDDTDIGLGIQVVGEPFPRILISSLGVRTGDGESDPLPVASLFDLIQFAIGMSQTIGDLNSRFPELPFEEGTFVLQSTVVNVEGTLVRSAAWVPLVP